MGNGWVDPALCCGFERGELWFGDGVAGVYVSCRGGRRISSLWVQPAKRWRCLAWRCADFLAVEVARILKVRRRWFDASVLETAKA